MSTGPIVRDERTVAVENASYRWAYLLMSYGLLGLAAYRGLVEGRAEWGPLGLVVLGGVVTTLYQGSRGVLSRRWAALVGGAVLVAAGMGAALALLR